MENHNSNAIPVGKLLHQMVWTSMQSADKAQHQSEEPLTQKGKEIHFESGVWICCHSSYPPRGPYTPPLPRTTSNTEATGALFEPPKMGQDNATCSQPLHADQLHKEGGHHSVLHAQAQAHAVGVTTKTNKGQGRRCKAAQDIQWKCCTANGKKPRIP